MVVGNSIGLRRLSGFYFHQFSEPVIIGQFSRAVEDGKRTIRIPMDHHLYSDVMTPIFVWRDLQFMSINADTVVGINGPLILLAKDVTKIPPNPRDERCPFFGGRLHELSVESWFVLLGQIPDRERRLNGISFTEPTHFPPPESGPVFWGGQIRYLYPPRPNHDKGDPRTYFPALKKKQFPAIYLWGWISIFFNCKEPDIPGWREDIRVIRIKKFSNHY